MTSFLERVTLMMVELSNISETILLFNDQISLKHRHWRYLGEMTTKD